MTGNPSAATALAAVCAAAALLSAAPAQAAEAASANGRPGPGQVIWAYWGHEPSEFLKRKSGGAFAIGEWLAAWYDRMLSEELVAKAAAIGINTVYCHYFKGLGLRHEHDNMERTRKFVEIAHRYGVRVLGYCTFGTMFYETMKDEVPDLEKWARIQYNGSIDPWRPHQYFRWRPCRESRGYMDYMKSVIAYGVQHVGLDGFHFDNMSVQRCYCDRCQRAFREWLAANVPNPYDACGLPHFRNVLLPPDPLPPGMGEELHDPIVLWCDRFRHARHDAAASEIFDHVRKVGGKIVVHNTGVFGTTFRGTGAYMPGARKSDMLFTENGKLIGCENGRNITQILAYKASRRYGFTLLDSNWRRADGKHAMIEGVDLMQRFLAQAMIYGNTCGTHWLLRSTRHGDRVMMDDPVVYSTVSNAFTFFRANPKLYDGSPVARTRLLFATDTLYGWSGPGRNSGIVEFIKLGDRLSDMGVPFLLTLEEDVDSVSPGELLVLPDMRYVNAALHAKIVAAASRGVRIVLTGKYGLYDENGRERDLDNPIIGLSEVRDTLRGIPDKARIKAFGPDGGEIRGIMVETTVNSSGEFVFHMLRPGNENTLDFVEVPLAEPRISASSKATLRSFDPGCRLESAECADGKATLRVRGLRTMASVVFGK